MTGDCGGDVAAVAKKFRVPDPWKVRWCTVCCRYEYDTGSPRGWVPLRGEPPAEIREEREGGKSEQDVLPSST
jgi:hypothetical protein